MHYLSLRIAFVLFLLTLYSFGIQSQTLKNTLRLQGKVVEGKERLQGVQIILYSEGEEVDRFNTSNNGRFTYLLPLEKNYDMVFYKPGYRSKYVRVLAKYIPEEDAAFGFEFGGIELALFKELSNLTSDQTLDQPMAQIIYDTNVYKFVFDASYFQEHEQEITLLNEELALLENKPEEVKQLQIEAQQAFEKEKQVLDAGVLQAMQKQNIQSTIPSTPTLNQAPKTLVIPEVKQAPDTEENTSVVSSPKPEIKTNATELPKPKPTIIRKPAKESVSQEPKPFKPQDLSGQSTFSKNIFRQGNKTITQVSLIQDGKEIQYRRVIADWGGRYFFKDDVPVTQITWETDLNAYIHELK